MQLHDMIEGTIAFVAAVNLGLSLMVMISDPLHAIAQGVITCALLLAAIYMRMYYSKK